MTLQCTRFLLSLLLATSVIGVGETNQALAEDDAVRSEKEMQYACAELLVEPALLAKPDLANECVILDARPEEDYESGHLPGARRVDHDSWKEAFKVSQDSEDWSKRIREMGISAESKVVLYDDKDMKDAARIWWILKYWGVENVQLLNGGWKGWQLAKLPTTTKVPLPPSRTDFIATRQPGRLATMDQILDLLPANRLQIVDARSEDEFCGIDKRDNKRGGAIPGARHLEWSALIDQETHRFKSAEQLRRLFDEAGIDLTRPTASHCDGGGRAAVMAFGLELMGAKEVGNYYRGWGEWGNADNTPIIVPKKKAP